jgi:hypothetical protein
MTRRMLLEVAGAYAETGKLPDRYADPDLYKVRALSLKLPVETPWADSGNVLMRADLGEPLGYEL